MIVHRDGVTYDKADCKGWIWIALILFTLPAIVVLA